MIPDTVFPVVVRPISLAVNFPKCSLTGENKYPSSNPWPRSNPPEPSFLSGENRTPSLATEFRLSSKKFYPGPLSKSLLSHASKDSLDAPPRHVFPQPGLTPGLKTVLKSNSEANNDDYVL